MWTDGAPDQPMPGMLLHTNRGVILVGHCGIGLNFYGDNDQTLHITAWAWLVEPGEIERIAERLRHERKGRA